MFVSLPVLPLRGVNLGVPLSSVLTVSAAVPSRVANPEFFEEFIICRAYLPDRASLPDRV